MQHHYATAVQPARPRDLRFFRNGEDQFVPLVWCWLSSHSDPHIEPRHWLTEHLIAEEVTIFRPRPKKESVHVSPR